MIEREFQESARGDAPAELAESTPRKLRPEKELSETFAGFTRRLKRQYAIDRGVLVLRDEEKGQLAAISTWRDGIVRDGLRLKLPADTSLFEKVAEHGRAFTDDFFGAFDGNFFERKLLLGDSTRSYVVQPLKSDGKVLGLLGYSSKQPSAFALFEEDELSGIADRFGKIIEKTCG